MQSALRVPDDARAARSGRFVTLLVLFLSALAALAQVGRLVYLLPVERYRSSASVEASLQWGDLSEPAFILLLMAFGGLIVLRSAERRYGWLMLATGFSVAILTFTSEYAQYALLVAPEANLPLGWLAGWVQDLWMVPFVLMFSMVFLFPNGRLPSARWRPIFWFHAVTWGLFVLVFAFVERPLTNEFLNYETAPPNPLGVIPMSPALYNGIFGSLFGLSLVTGIASLVSRWRSTGGEVRQQIKWVVYAFLVMLMTLAASFVNTILIEAVGLDLGLSRILEGAMNFALLGVLAALGLAVLKYRLYDIDLLINRTLVYGALTAIIVATYVFVVAGVGALLPLQDNLFLSLLATGIIAVLFNPLRLRLQGAANRLMFGQRDDPYAVLSRLGRLLSDSAAPEATLHTVVKAVATALKLPYVAIELEQRGHFETKAEYGRATVEPMALPLVHQNELVGRLVVARRAPGEPLTAKDRRLLEDIAHQAAAVAHAVRLTAALRRSRQQLVTAREEERRRLRRDLHDGLGPSLASQTFKLDAALDLLGDDPQEAAHLLHSLKEQTQQLVADIRRLVYQLRPPALDELGLAGALRAHVGQIKDRNGLSFTIMTRPDPLPALPAAVEAAAYGIALEGITNVVRHAQARECTVALEAEPSCLRLTVADDGVGLPASVAPGVGLASMRERAEELGGTVEVGARPGGGARVTALLPLTLAPGAAGRRKAQTSTDLLETEDEEDA